jgi:hypothetical protein
MAPAEPQQPLPAVAKTPSCSPVFACHFTVGPGHKVLALKADEMIGRGAFCGDADRMTGPEAVNRGDRVATGLLFPFLKCRENLRSVVGRCYLD